MTLRAPSRMLPGPMAHPAARTLSEHASKQLLAAYGVPVAPDEVLRAGDVLVVIGTHDGINGVRRIIEA